MFFHWILINFYTYPKYFISKSWSVLHIMCICIFLRICLNRLKRIWRRQKTLWNKVEQLRVFSITHRMFSTIYDDYLLTICTLLAGSVFYGHLLWHNIFSRMHILILKCTSSLLYVPLYVLYGVYFFFS